MLRGFCLVVVGLAVVLGAVDANAEAGKAGKAGKTPPRSPWVVRQLYHQRSAATIVKALEGHAPASVKLSHVGDDTLVLSGPALDVLATDALIASLDLPRAQISLQFWSIRLAGRPSATSRRAIGLLHGELRERVRRLSFQLQSAISRGVDYLYDEVNAAKTAGTRGSGAFFRHYLEDPVERRRADGPRYSLGYRDAFTKGSSLSKLFLFLAGLDLEDSSIDDTITNLTTRMSEKVRCSTAAEQPAKPVFREFDGVLKGLLREFKARRLRAALADFLFHYKQSVQYPRDLIGYDYRRSADELDALFGPAIAAFNGDIERCVGEAIQSFIRKPWLCDGAEGGSDACQSGTDAGELKSLAEEIDSEFGGLSSVTTLSASPAKVTGQSSQYYGFTQQPSLGDLIDAAKDAAGDDDSGDLLGVLKNDPRAAAARVALAVAKRALETEKRTVEIAGGTTLEVTPLALAAASSAELNIAYEVGERQPPQVQGEAAEIQPIDRILRHRVEDKVRIQSLGVFEISSLSDEGTVRGARCDYPGFWDWVLGRPVSRCPAPVIGHLWDFLIGWIPGGVGNALVTPLSISVEAEERLTHSSAIVAAIVVPTAADVGLSIRFDLDRDAQGRFFPTTDALRAGIGVDSRAYHKCILRKLASESDVTTGTWCTDSSPQ